MPWKKIAPAGTVDPSLAGEYTLDEFNTLISQDQGYVPEGMGFAEGPPEDIIMEREMVLGKRRKRGGREWETENVTLANLRPEDAGNMNLPNWVRARAAGLQSMARREQWKQDLGQEEYLLDRLPFSPTQAIENLMVSAAQDRISLGSATRADYELVADAQQKQVEKSQKGVFRQAGDAITQLPAMGVEFALTGGAASGALNAVNAVRAGRQLPKLGRLASAATRLGTQAIAMPNRIAEATGRKLQEGDDMEVALLKGFGDTATEVLTETLGGTLINKIGGKIGSNIGQTAVAQGLKNWFMKTKVGKGTGKVFAERKYTKALKTAGYDGMLTEFAEERLGDAIRGAAGIEDGYGMFTNPEWQKQAAVELLTFAFPGAANVIMSQATSAKEQLPRADVQPEYDPNLAPEAKGPSSAAFIPEERMDFVMESIKESGVEVTKNTSRSQITKLMSGIGFPISKRFAGRVKNQILKAQAKQSSQDDTVDVSPETPAMEQGPLVASPRAQFAPKDQELEVFPANVKTESSPQYKKKINQLENWFADRPHRGGMQELLKYWARLESTPSERRLESKNPQPEIDAFRDIAMQLGERPDTQQSRMMQARAQQAQQNQESQTDQLKPPQETPELNDQGLALLESLQSIEDVRSLASIMGHKDLAKTRPADLESARVELARRMTTRLPSKIEADANNSLRSAEPAPRTNQQAAVDETAEARALMMSMSETRTGGDMMQQRARTLKERVAQARNKKQEESFNLSREPEKVPSKPVIEGKGKETQKEFLDTGRRDLPGQKLAFDTDGFGEKTAADFDGPKQEPSIKQKVQEAKKRQSKAKGKQWKISEKRKWIAEKLPGTKIVKPKTAAMKDAVAIGEFFGVDVQVMDTPTAVKGWAIRNRDTVFISGDLGTNGVYHVLGHELTHALGIDYLKDAFTKDRVDAATSRYMKEAKDKLPKKLLDRLLQDEDLRTAEGIATMIGDMFIDPSFRSEIQKESPSLIAKVVAALKSLLDRVKLDKDTRAAIQAFVDANAKRKARNLEEGYQQIEDEVLTEFEQRYNLALEKAMEDRAEQEQAWYDAAAELLEVKGSTAARRRFGVEQRRKKINSILQDEKKDYADIPGYDLLQDMENRELQSRMSVIGSFDDPSDFWNAIAAGPKLEAIEKLEAKAEAEALGSMEDPTSQLREAKKRIDAIAQGKNSDDYLLMQDLAAIAAEEMGLDTKDPKEAVMAMIEAIYRMEKAADFNIDDIGESPFTFEGKDDDLRSRLLKRISEIPNADKLIKEITGRNLPTNEELETKRYQGRANPGETQAVRDQVFASDVSEGRPGTRSRAVAHLSAVKRYQENAKAEKEKFLKRFREQDFSPLDEEDTNVLNLLLNDIGFASAMQSEQALSDFHVLNSGRRKVRTETARTLSMRDPALRQQAARHQRAVQEVLAEIEDRGKLQELLDLLKDKGFDLTDPRTLDDPKSAIAVMREIRRSTSGKSPIRQASDMIYEFWQNMILSGPQTHMANILGNTAHSGYMIGERIIEAAINDVVGSKFSNSNASLREAKYYWNGLLNGIRPAIHNMMKTWDQEFSEFDFAMQAAVNPSSKIEDIGVSIPGKFGKAVRSIGWRPLQAADDFGRTLFAYAVVGSEAYREAKKQGVRDTELTKFVASEMQDYASLSWSRAIKLSRDAAFQQEGGQTAKAFKSAGQRLRAIPSMRYVIPFVNTPTNILASVLERTPLGQVVKLADHYYSGKPVNYAMESGRALLFATAYAAIWSLMSSPSDDDQLPLITGSRSSDPGKRALQYATAPPQSIRIGDTYYSYARVEPFASLVTAIVDSINTAKDSNSVSDATIKATGGAVSSLISQADDKSFMQGIADVSKVLEDSKQGGNVALMNLGKNIVGGFSPNIYKQTARSIGNRVQSTRATSEDEPKDIAKKLAVEMFAPGFGYMQKHDMFGRPIERRSYSTSIPWRIAQHVADPVTGITRPKSTKDILDVNLAIVRYNEEHPEDPYYKRAPNRTQTWNGNRFKMSTEQYEEFVKKMGTYALNRIKEIEFPKKVTRQHIDTIDRILDESRRAVVGEIYQKYHGKTQEN